MPIDWTAGPPWAMEDREKRRGPSLDRILALAVPLTVVIAEQRMPLGKLLDVQPGSVIEFDKPFDAPLELRIHDRGIAAGQAVLLADHLGLQITEISDRADRIKKLGPPRV